MNVPFRPAPVPAPPEPGPQPHNQIGTLLEQLGKARTPRSPAREPIFYDPKLAQFGMGHPARPCETPGGDDLLAEVVRRLLPRLKDDLLRLIAVEVGLIIKEVLRDRGL
jgi:hypothetical protein